LIRLSGTVKNMDVFVERTGTYSPRVPESRINPDPPPSV
jgi:CHAD domain-containing protein